MIRSLKGKHLLVLGLGISGLGAAALARDRGAAVTVLDAATNADLEERAERLRALGATVRLGCDLRAWDQGADLAIVSPGIAATSSLGHLAAGLDCPLVSELEFGFRGCRCPLLAVTGTNGKTTTVEAVTHCLQHAGKRALAAGNIGVALSAAALQSADLDVIVAEVSSFQLERCDRFAPRGAALLNVTSDHQNRYPTFADYVRTKLLLFKNLRDARRILLREDVLACPECRDFPLFQRQRPRIFAPDDRSGTADYFLDAEGWLCFRRAGGVDKLVHRRELKLLGDHNMENVLATLALCRFAGVPHAAAVAGAKTFAPSEHRLEVVAEADGIRYVNDSKATNPDAVIQALRTLSVNGAEGRIFLLAGGRDKQMDFASLVPYLRTHVRKVFLIGENRQALAAQWGAAVPCELYPSLEAAVDAAACAALAAGGPGIVLLSPACASQDMFKDYKHRGNAFIAEVKRRLGE